MKFLHYLILAAIATFAPLLLSANTSMNQLQNLKMKNAKFPIFSDSDELQMMIFGEEAVRNGLLMHITNPIMDVIRKGLSTSDVAETGGDKTPYSLNATLPEVVNFWKNRLYSQGVLFTVSADLNTDTKEAMGEGNVFFRSPLLDLNGVGFRADYERKIILVQQQIEFVIRAAGSNPENFSSGEIPTEDYQPLRGSGDRLMIDLENNRIVLMDNVELYERSGKLTCDEITIIPGKSNKSASEDDSSNALSSFAGGGISEIICRGNVVAARTPEEEDPQLQEARAPEMRYLVTSGTIEMIAEDGILPVMISGENRITAQKIVIDRPAGKMTLYNDCRVDFTGKGENAEPEPGVIKAKEMSLDMKNNSGLFSGNVRVDNPRMHLESDQVEMKLTSKEEAEKSEDYGLIGLGMPTASNKLKELVFLDNVWMVSKDAEGNRDDLRRAAADRAVLDYEKNILTLFGDKSSSIGYGGNSIAGKTLEIHLNEEKLISPLGNTVTLTGGRGEEADPSTQTTVTSDSGNFDYGGNLMTFNDNVQIRDTRMSLECDKMEIFLIDAAGTTDEEKTSDRLDFGVYQNRKSLQKIVCRGNVKVCDRQTILDTDELTFLFSPLAPGEEADPTIFQSNGTRLDRIELGQIRMTRNTAANSNESGNIELPLGNLFGNSRQASTMIAQRGWINLREDSAGFHEKVKISNSQGSLECEDLYLYAEPAAASERSSIDAANIDPYAREVDVPSIISLDSHRRLREMVAEHNVRFSRTTAQNTIQRCGGDRAVYNVARRVMQVTADPGRQPFIEEAGTGIIESDTGSIFVYPDADRMNMDGGVRGVIQDHSIFKNR